MLYTEPQIFRKNGIHHFARFVGKLLEEPFMAHVNHECRQLMPVFQAASDVLRPHSYFSSDFKTLTPEGIAKTHRMSAAAYGSLLTNMPIVIEEGFAGMNPLSYAPDYYPLKKALHKAGIYNVLEVSYLEPGGGSRKTNRMFGTGRYGFITIKYDDGSNYHKAIMLPYVTAPKAFLKLEGAKDVLKENARLGIWVNHDWFHNMTAGMVNSDIIKSDMRSPMRKHGSSMRGYQFNSIFRNQGRITLTNSGLEHWAMRLQREILSKMMRTANNPLSEGAKDFVAAFKRSGLAASDHVMSDPHITASEYAGRLLASNLVRAVPKGHHTPKSALKDCFAICAAEGFENAQSDFTKGYDTVYNGRWAEDVIFGGSTKYLDARTYQTHIKDMSADAISLSYDDSRKAFNPPSEQERINSAIQIRLDG